MDIDDFRVLKLLYFKAGLSQRKIATELNLSLGKVNYQLQILKKENYIFLNNGMGAAGLSLAILCAYTVHTIIQTIYLMHLLKKSELIIIE